MARCYQHCIPRSSKAPSSHTGIMGMGMLAVGRETQNHKRQRLQSPSPFVLPQDPSWGQRAGVRSFATIPGLVLAQRGDFVQWRIWVRNWGFTLKLLSLSHVAVPPLLFALLLASGISPKLLLPHVSMVGGAGGLF